MPRPMRLTLAAALLACAPLAAAVSLTPTADLRLRHERVDDDAFADTAEATTLRARLGLLFGITDHWSAFLEAEHTSHLGSERFNSTANGRTTWPVVADPDNTELNQAWLRYTVEGTRTLTLGRQRLVHGNHRFFGNVGWRQNEQTFDALDWQETLPGGVRLRYDWLDRVQRIFGADHPQPAQARWDLDAHLLAADWTAGAGTLSAYAHLIDNRTLPTTSHRNLGLRYAFAGKSGDRWSWTAAAELASQRPYADGADRNRAEYAALELGLGIAGNTFTLGHERLGGDGSYGFATPFATLHAFNGWADRFLATPPDGLRDTWLGWKRSFGAWTAQLVHHDFTADHGSADYGSEWDASVAWTFAPRWSALLKLARYDADAFGTDVDKHWISVEYRY